MREGCREIFAIKRQILFLFTHLNVAFGWYAVQLRVLPIELDSGAQSLREAVNVVVDDLLINVIVPHSC